MQCLPGNQGENMKCQKFNHIAALVGTDEVELKPVNGSATVAGDKSARYIHGYFFNEQSGALNTIKLRVYDSNSTLVEEIPVMLTPNQTISDGREIPFLRIPSGSTLKAISNSANILVVLQFRDE